MRILVVHHNPTGAITGAVSMARSTATELRARGHRVVLQEHAIGDSGHQRGGVQPGPAGPRGQWQDPASPRGQWQDPDWAPDIVHLVDLADPSGGLAARAAASTVGAAFVVTPATDMRLWRDRGVGIEIARSADVVFALTDEERRILAAAGVSSRRLVKIPQAPLLGGRADPAGIKERLGLRGRLVLFLSRKLETKGYQHLLLAAPDILARHPRTTVAFAGPDPDGTAAARIAAIQDDRVVDLGVLDENDKHSVLLAADILCVPSVADSFPVVFTEAWWCGTPVVTGPFPGCTEVVRDRVDGRIVQAEPRAVAAAIIELLDDPVGLDRMAQAGRLRAQQEYRWDRVVDDIEDNYRRVLRTRDNADKAAISLGSKEA